MNIKRFLLVLVLAAMAVVSVAQGGGGRFFRSGPMAANPGFLLQRDDVQADLKDNGAAITDDQKAKLAELRDSTGQEMRQVFQDSNGDRDAAQKGMQAVMKKASDEIKKILTPAQSKRLQEIGIQVAGNSILINDKDLQTALNLTADQKTKIDDLQKKQQEANSSVFQKVQSGEIDRSQIGDIMKKNNDALNTAIGALLTDEQKAKLKTLSGKTFTPKDDQGGG